MPSALDYALRYAQLGWAVFPLEVGGKRPLGRLVPQGFKMASRDPATISAWWRAEPQANIGVPAGVESGFWVLDVDPRNGGEESIARLEAQHGELGAALIQRTGGGGRHLIYSHDPAVRRGVLGPGLDVKRDGGYIVVEPSTTTAAYGFLDWDVLSEPLELHGAPAWLTRLCAVSPPGEKGGPTEAWDADRAKLRSALWVLDCDEYHDWISIGAALYHASKGHAEALALWDQWSARSQRYQAQACTKRWEGFANYGGGARATLASIYWRAQQAGWAWRTPKPAQPAPAAAGSVQAQPAVEDDHPLLVDEGWQHCVAELRIPGKREPWAECRENVALILQHHPDWRGVVAWDEFAQRIIKRRVTPWGREGTWDAQDDLELGMWLAQASGLRLLVKAEAVISAGVSLCAYRHRVHPVREFLETAAAGWDGVPRAETWLHEWLGAPDTQYSALVGRYFVLNMVARVLDPGCICRSVVVLEGAQDKGKSTALRLLAQPWYSDTMLDLHSKDAYQAIQGVWLQEIPEMHAFTRADANRVKEFVSSRTDNFRPPYERRMVQAPRQVVFAGSTNDRVYLKDWTGNTRFNPVAVMRSPGSTIRLDLIEELRVQLFGEAVQRYRQAEERHPSVEVYERIFKPEVETREQNHPWEPVIDSYLVGRSEITVGELLADCLKFETSKMQEAHEAAVGRILGRLGWERKRRSTGQRQWYYVRASDSTVSGPRPVASTAAADTEQVPF